MLEEGTRQGTSVSARGRPPMIRGAPQVHAGIGGRSVRAIRVSRLFRRVGMAALVARKDPEREARTW